MTVESLDSVPISGRVAVDALVGELRLWPGVEIGEHRFDGPIFRLGRRELGHLHREVGGACLAALPVPRSLHDELIAAGRARKRHAFTSSGWLTLAIRTVSDLRDAVEVFRISYERGLEPR
jgi:Luciferase